MHNKTFIRNTIGNIIGKFRVKFLEIRYWFWPSTIVRALRESNDSVFVYINFGLVLNEAITSDLSNLSSKKTHINTQEYPLCFKSMYADR